MKKILLALIILSCYFSNAQTNKQLCRIGKAKQLSEAQKHLRTIRNNPLHTNQKPTRQAMYLLKDSVFSFDTSFAFESSRQYSYSGTRSSHLKFDNIEDVYSGGYILDLIGINADYDQVIRDDIWGLDKVLRTYNTSNQIVSEINLDYNISTMQFDTNYVINNIYTNNLMTLSEKIYNSNFSYKTIYTYNTSNQLVADTTLKKTSIGGNYENEWNVQYLYVGNNISEIISQVWNSNMWKNSFKEFYTYNANNNKTSYNQAEWNNGISWSILDPIYVTYNANQSIDSIYYKDSANVIETLLKYTYQGINTLPEKLDIYGIDSGLNYNGKIDFTYNNDNFLIKKQGKEYIAPNTFEDGDYTNYYYQNGPSTTNDVQKSIGLNLFPNPAINNTYISYSTDEALESKIIVTDIIGKQVFTTAAQSSIGDHLIKIPVYYLPSGLYIIQLKVGDAIYQTKFIKQ